MSDYPSLAEVLAGHQGYQASVAQSTWVCERPCGWRGDVNGGRGQWESHVADAWREACTIRSVEQLDALPAQSVIRDDIGDRDGYVYEKSPDGEGDVPWWHDGDPTNVDEIDLPALLIFHPDWSKP